MKIDVEILEIIKKAHLEDIKFSKSRNCVLDGLCTLSSWNLKIKKRNSFINYLKFTTGKNTGAYFWDRKPTNKSRLNWLNKHIKLNTIK